MKTLSVLVVEDHPDTREMLINVLTGCGYEVTSAKDGAIAWQLLEIVQPDLIVTDLTMPHVSGFELIRHIRDLAEFRHIPVVAISAFGGECLKDAQKAGATHILRKPFEAENLTGLISTALAA
jgi:CheY-like chemotaxis protein